MTVNFTREIYIAINYLYDTLSSLQEKIQSLEGTLSSTVVENLISKQLVSQSHHYCVDYVPYSPENMPPSKVSPLPSLTPDFLMIYNIIFSSIL